METQVPFFFKAQTNWSRQIATFKWAICLWKLRDRITHRILFGLSIIFVCTSATVWWKFTSTGLGERGLGGRVFLVPWQIIVLEQVFFGNVGQTFHLKGNATELLLLESQIVGILQAGQKIFLSPACFSASSQIRCRHNIRSQMQIATTCMFTPTSVAGYPDLLPAKHAAVHVYSEVSPAVFSVHGVGPSNKDLPVLHLALLKAQKTTAAFCPVQGQTKNNYKCYTVDHTDSVNCREG